MKKEIPKAPNTKFMVFFQMTYWVSIEINFHLSQLNPLPPCNIEAFFCAVVSLKVAIYRLLGTKAVTESAPTQENTRLSNKWGGIEPVP